MTDTVLTKEQAIYILPEKYIIPIIFREGKPMPFGEIGTAQVFLSTEITFNTVMIGISVGKPTISDKIPLSQNFGLNLTYEGKSVYVETDMDKLEEVWKKIKGN